MEANLSYDFGSMNVEQNATRVHDIYLLTTWPRPSSLWFWVQSTFTASKFVIPWSEAQPALPALLSAVFIAAPFLVIYFATWISFQIESSSQMPVRVPPTIPYMIPYLGTALSFGVNPSKCLTATRQTVGSPAAYSLHLLGKKLFFLYGPQNVARIWKYRTSISSPSVAAFCLTRIFGVPPAAVDMYEQDDSGLLPKPHPQSNVLPHNRIDHRTHANWHRNLTGERLSGLYLRWSQNFARRLQAMGIGDTWIEAPDIMDFWRPPQMAALNEALTGPLLECVNPNFFQDFLTFLPFVHDLMKGLPNWCIPKAVSLRNSLKRDVSQWQSIARARFRDSDVAEDGDADPWWGSALFRERQEILGGVDHWDKESVASCDFGLLWGAHINVHTAAAWTIIEIFKDPDLLSRIRTELDTIDFTAITSSQDMEKILSLPLLQSVHAEVLRLRVELQAVFYNKREDIQINEWRFPKKNIIVVPTGPAHRDANFWNTQDGKYPLDTFWADRFLQYPNDPRSGPQRKTVAVKAKGETSGIEDTKGRGQPKFISAGLSDTYFPYGVGERTCPGRFYARRQIVAFCANIVHDFDIELLTDQKHFESSSMFFGLGVQTPREKVSFRIRRKAKS